ncbi:MAG: endonuclease/exonuclease/phosphatase family protein [Rhodobacteraceae bacterium]|nr:endonuclease/exonuclease/phosphatase family protein [Paracoccaceae bacterium]
MRLLLPLLLLFPLSATAQDETRLRVLSFNIWYGGDQVSFAKVVEAIRLSDADIVGLQEPDGRTAEIAAAAGYPYVDTRRHILSRYPIFDSGAGETTATEAPPYSTAGLDPDALHALVQVAPHRVVAVANTHLTSDPYGPELLRDGATPEEVLANESDTRLPEAEALITGLAPVIAAGIPLIVTGDFNSPSHLDESGDGAIPWPVSKAMEAAGFTDAFRAANPDPVAQPGLTWTPGRPYPSIPENETLDRIDFVWIANATATTALVMGEAGNPQNGLSITPWPSDHRAVLAELSLTPAPAPARIAVEPRPLRLGDSFTLRALLPERGLWSGYVVPRGAGADAAIIGIGDVDSADRPTVRLSTLGLAPGDYDALLLDAEGTEIARTAFTLQPEGATATLEVTAPVTPGSDVALRFTGAPGFKLDWVGIYRKGDPSVYNYLGFAYTGSRLSGDLTFPAEELYEELSPGDYEARLMFDDHYRIMAIAPFAVTAP